MPHHDKIEILAPLFHRMVDEEPSVSEEAKPLRTLSVAELKKSIREEVSWLLNTRYSRLPFSIHALDDNKKSWNDKSAYGLIDFSHFDVTQTLGKRKLERHIKRALEFYESRLQDLVISVKSFNHRDQSARVVISGDINAVPEAERYTFPVDVQQAI
ncbi:MAG: type VI secretion system baseplate subunit TssE [Pseudomonadota bacterium]